MARAAAGSLRASGITVALIDLQGRACSCPQPSVDKFFLDPMWPFRLSAAALRATHGVSDVEARSTEWAAGRSDQVPAPQNHSAPFPRAVPCRYPQLPVDNYLDPADRLCSSSIRAEPQREGHRSDIRSRKCMPVVDIHNHLWTTSRRKSTPAFLLATTLSTAHIRMELHGKSAFNNLMDIVLSSPENCRVPPAFPSQCKDQLSRDPKPGIRCTEGTDKQDVLFLHPLPEPSRSRPSPAFPQHRGTSHFGAETKLFTASADQR